MTNNCCAEQVEYVSSRHVRVQAVKRVHWQFVARKIKLDDGQKLRAEKKNAEHDEDELGGCGLAALRAHALIVAIGNVPAHAEPAELVFAPPADHVLTPSVLVDHD